jgi:hypothetical protein
LTRGLDGDRLRGFYDEFVQHSTVLTRMAPRLIGTRSAFGLPSPTRTSRTKVARTQSLPRAESRSRERSRGVCDGGWRRGRDEREGSKSVPRRGETTERSDRAQWLIPAVARRGSPDLALRSNTGRVSGAGAPPTQSCLTALFRPVYGGRLRCATAQLQSSHAQMQEPQPATLPTIRRSPSPPCSAVRTNDTDGGVDVKQTSAVQASLAKVVNFWIMDLVESSKIAHGRRIRVNPG